jgi:predicted HicB family RNase H-like nuclease
MMIYKGYIGQTELDEEAGIISGEVVNTKDVITFQGTTVPEVQKAFRESVEDYLAFCRERGEKPDKPFSGKLVVRMEPDLHQAIYLRAREKGTSLNGFITETLASMFGTTCHPVRAMMKGRRASGQRMNITATPGSKVKKKGVKQTF